MTSPSGPAGQAGAESPTPSTEEADHEHPHRVSDGCHQEERRSQALPGGDLDELLQELIAAGLNLPGCAAIADCHQGAIEGHPDIRFERVSNELFSQWSARLACDDADEMAAEGAPIVQWLMEKGWAFSLPDDPREPPKKAPARAKVTRAKIPGPWLGGAGVLIPFRPKLADPPATAEGPGEGRPDGDGE